MAIKRHDYHFCPICGAALDTGEHCTDCERLEAKAAIIGYSIRAKRHSKGVFEILNNHGIVIGEGNDVDRLGDFLDILAKPALSDRFRGVFQ